MWHPVTPPLDSMSEETRQSKLARAKKKLRDYQRKTGNLPGGSEKQTIKNGGSPQTTSCGYSHPEDIQDILKVLVADLNRSNGVALSPLAKWKAPKDGATSPVEPADAQAAFSYSLSNVTPLQTCDTCDHLMDENLTMSSTESLRQISQQLNGLVAESSSFINGEDLTSNIRDLENRQKELSIALESSTVTNKELISKIEELEKQNQDIANQRENDKKEFEQKFAKEQYCLRQQLTIHIQTIGILVSEKSDLQTCLYHTQNAVRQKEGELENVVSHLKASQQRIGDLERTLSALSKQQKHMEKKNKELYQELDNATMKIVKNSTKNEDLLQHNSELTEQLQMSLKEKTTMQQGIEDLQKKLDMSELLLQQFSSNENNKVLEKVQAEKAKLEQHTEELTQIVKQLQMERDHYVETLKTEGTNWRQQVQKLSEQVQTLKKEKECSLIQTQELEASLAEFKKQTVIPPPEEETPMGPSEEELRLQAETEKLQKELEDLKGQLQSQMRDNETLNLQSLEREQQLRELQRIADCWNEQEAAREKILETMQSDRITISLAVSQNHELKAQLAELQDSFIKLTNDKMELTASLQSEQHVKNELAKKLDQLQEKLGDLKETVELKSQEAHSLQEQRDQYLGHLQQYTASYQQQITLYQHLALEKEELQKQLLLQTQLTEQLQVHQSQESLEASSQQKQELQAQRSHIALAEKDNVRDSEERDEEAPQPELSIPEGLDTRDALVAFFNSALASARQERAWLKRQLKEQELRCQQLAHLEATSKHESMVPAPGTGENSVSAETYQALQVAMEKLQGQFAGAMQEKRALQERLDQLEYQCVQLSGETDTIGEYIALYQSQRTVLKERHRVKEEYISQLARDKEIIKVKLLALQELVLQLVGEKNEYYKKYLAAFQSSSDGEQIAPSAPQELEAIFGQDRSKINQAEDVEPVQGETVSDLAAPENSTAQQIMQLLRDIQYPREHPGLGKNPCIPFFYRPDQQDEVKVMMI